MRRISGKSEAESAYLREQQQRALNRKKTLGRYGLSPVDYEAMAQRQRHRCPICRKPLTRGVIDHDHQTGRVRSILCDADNKALGLMGDDPDRVQRASEYLRAHHSK